MCPATRKHFAVDRNRLQLGALVTLVTFSNICLNMTFNSTTVSWATRWLSICDLICDHMGEPLKLYEVIMRFEVIMRSFSALASF